MKYDKPTVRAVVSAADAIQSSTIKKLALVMETFAPYQYATTPAYEADE
jgi:hypothetical protein